jgi:uncharacterized damage-inducible protein DinB
MPQDGADLLEHYREMRAELLAALEGLTEEQMSERTLDGWSVKDHLFHLALWDEIRAAEIERISAGHDSLWRMTGEQDAAYSGLGHVLRDEASVAQALWEIEATRRRVLDAIGSATERGLDGSLYGEAGLRSGHEAQHTQWIKGWRSEKGF